MYKNKTSASPQPERGDSLDQKIDELKLLLEKNINQAKIGPKSIPASPVGNQKELHKLLQENLQVSRDLYEMMKKINRWITWQRIWGVIKVLIIVIPIVLGIIYLPPLLQGVVDQYRELLNPTQNVEVQAGLLDQFNNQIGNGQAN